MNLSSNISPALASKLRLLAEFSFIAVVAGIIFQMIESQFVDFRSILMGFSLGLTFWGLELFILNGYRKNFTRLPLIVTICLKALIYLSVIIFITLLLGLIVGFFQGKEMEDFYNSILDSDHIVLIVYTLVLYVLLSFYMQINFLLGEKVLFKFLIGKYRKPTDEHRVFMFLDLKSSTSIAEKLGHLEYYSFLNDFFHDISDPVRSTSAEIYQYVGDEVVFTWKTEDALDDANCLKIFFEIQEQVVNNQHYYLQKYGEVPSFKAGLHFGEVITAQIGDIKKEIVYNGDVLNTSARIQEQCNTLNRELLISGALLDQLEIKKDYRIEKMETVQLRGKDVFTELYSLVRL